jgi:Nucleotidyl transferase AbiEii toxin, Type IV TA system
VTLPGELRRILPAETAEAWELVAPIIPPDCSLAGGTALAVHLGHRESRDLDFFFADGDLDLDALERSLRAQGELAVTRRAAGTLNCQLGGAKLQFLHDGCPNIDAPLIVRGIPVLGISDLFAMKVNTIGGRGELRDYFDLQQIELLTGRRFEEGLGLYQTRYGVSPADASIPHIVQSLGYLDDVDDDHMLPTTKAQIEAYWRRRQPQVLRSLSRHAAGASAEALHATIPMPPPGCTLNCYLSALPAAECACPCGGEHHGTGRASAGFLALAESIHTGSGLGGRKWTRDDLYER